MNRRLAAPALAAVLACHGAPRPSLDAGDGTSTSPKGSGPRTELGAPPRSALPDAAVLALPPRCHAVVAGSPSAAATDGGALPASALVGGDASDVEVGEATWAPAGLAIGLLRASAAHTVSVIAIVSGDLQRRTTVDLGAPPGDPPPPKPFVLQGELWAAAYTQGSRDASIPHARMLGLFRIEAEQGTSMATVEQRADESPAFDVAGGERGALVAWDEDAPAGDHGLIKVATFEKGHLGEPRVVSPDGTDADEPQVSPRAGGYWLAWIARRADARGDAGDALEGPAEARDVRWVELLPLDESGKAAGSVHRLTSSVGHVSAFVMARAGPLPSSPSGSAAPPRADALAADSLLLFARDDEEAFDGAGGRILRVGVHGDGSAGAPTVLVATGAGRGAPALLGGGSGPVWLAFADTGDRTRLVALGDGALPPGPPSPEPSLDDARILALSRSNELIAAFPAERGGGWLAPLRAFACTP